MVKEPAEGCREGEGPSSQRPRKLHKERDSVFWVPSKNRRGGGGKGSGGEGGEPKRRLPPSPPWKGGVGAGVCATPEGGSSPPPSSERRRTNGSPPPCAGEAGRKPPAFKLSLTVAQRACCDQKGWRWGQMIRPLFP